MELKKVYYTRANIIQLSLPFIIRTKGKEAFQVDIPAKTLRLEHSAEDQPKNLIQESLFEAVKEKLGTGKFFLIPSRREVELEAYNDAQMYHPENFPMSSDESIGFFGGHYD